MKQSTTLIANLRAASLGLALVVLTMLCGQGMGIVFGLNEDVIKSRLEASSSEVRDSIYKGNDLAIKAVLDKSWNYMQRAHLHAGGMGTTAVSLTIVLCLFGTSRPAKAVIAIAIALGAPALGCTGATNELQKWLAMLSSRAFVLATVAVILVLIAAIVSRRILLTSHTPEATGR